MADQTATLLRELPAVDRLLKHSGCERLLARYNREYITAQCRAVLEQIRNEVRRSGTAVDSVIVQATAKYRGQPVAGSPVRLVIVLQPGS